MRADRCSLGVLIAVVLCWQAATLPAAPPAAPVTPKSRPVPEFTPGSWTLVLLPDTQCYAYSYPGLLTLQTQWIAKNRERYAIRYAVGLGDSTDRNSDLEWRRVREAYEALDGRVPYALAAGNHDYTPPGNTTAGRSGLNRYFPPERFRAWPTFGGVMKEGDSTNCYHLFRAGETDWLLLVLEWAPRDATVQWAREIAAKHPGRKAILATHAYLYDDNTRYDFARRGASQHWHPHEQNFGEPVNDGEELWQKLVGKGTFVLTLNGHVCGRGQGFLSSKNAGGKTVQQMLVNYQMRPLGGEGYLRLLEFQPDGRTVQVKSYSPLYDKYLTDEANQFRFELDP